MSTNPEKAVSYVLSKYVTEYMDKDVLKLDDGYTNKRSCNDVKTL